jgi:radical SAM superfamily enzyme YgiQ (UPF0313 family)
MAGLLFLQDLEYPFLGPMYLSACLKRAGHRVALAIGRTADELLPRIRAFQPNVLAFSIMTGSHRWARELAHELKVRTGIPTLFGGAHPTFFPQFADHPAVDWIVRGEAEETVVELLDALDAGRSPDGIANLGYRRDGVRIQAEVRNLVRDLDDLPFPDRDLYADLIGRMDLGIPNVITSRGCPFHCSFCFEDAQRELYKDKGKYVRIRRIDAVLAECRELMARPDVRAIYFADDVFGMSKKWLYEFLPAYKREIGLPFVCLVRADIVASDPEYARRLAEGGCRSVFFGVESGNEDLRNTVLAKQLTDAQIRTAAERLHAAGIAFRTYNILGLPGETWEDALATVKLNIEIGADYPWASLFAPYPGTALAAHAIETGHLDPDWEPDKLSRSFFLDTPVSGPDARRIHNLQKLFQTAVLFPRALPLVEKLVELPPNPLFRAWFGLVYFHVYTKSEMRSRRQTLRFALRNVRHVLRAG